jgi:phage-related protein
LQSADLFRIPYQFDKQDLNRLSVSRATAVFAIPRGGSVCHQARESVSATMLSRDPSGLRPVAQHPARRQTGIDIEELNVSAVKHAFQELGKGIKDVADGIGHAVEGAVKTVGGALTLNPSLMKSGAKEFDSGVKQSVTGVGEAAGGLAGAAVGMSPVGAAVNAMTGGAASRLATGTFEGAASTINGGITGAEDIADGVAHGNFGEVAKGMVGVGQVAMLAVPGAGEGELAASAVAKSATTDLLKDSAKDQLASTVTGQQEPQQA